MLGKHFYRRFAALVMGFLLIFVGTLSVYADSTQQVDNVSLDLACKSAILMEESTGKILYEQNADESICVRINKPGMKRVLVLPFISGFCF